MVVNYNAQRRCTFHRVRTEKPKYNLFLILTLYLYFRRNSQLLEFISTRTRIVYNRIAFTLQFLKRPKAKTLEI